MEYFCGFLWIESHLFFFDRNIGIKLSKNTLCVWTRSAGRWEQKARRTWSPFAIAPICVFFTAHSFGNSTGKKLKLKTQSTWNGIAIMGATDMHMCGKCSNILLPVFMESGAVEGCHIRLASKHSIKAYFWTPQNGVAAFHAAPWGQPPLSLL